VEIGKKPLLFITESTNLEGFQYNIGFYDHEVQSYEGRTKHVWSQSLGLDDQLLALIDTYGRLPNDPHLGERILNGLGTAFGCIVRKLRKRTHIRRARVTRC